MKRSDHPAQRTTIFILAALVIGVFASTTSALARSGSPALPATVGAVAAYDHIFVILMENVSYGTIVDNPAEAPYINGTLLPLGSVASNYFSVGHPSLLNYMALTGGDTFFTSNCYIQPGACTTSALSIVDRLEAAGRTWKGYMEDLPASPSCFVGDRYPYVEKHNPFIHYDRIRNNPGRCSRIVPYTQLMADLSSRATTPDYVWITPNMCHDMHDCTVLDGDTWLSQQVPNILNKPAFTEQNSLLVLTWDEDDGTTPANQVAAIAVGSRVQPGSRPGTRYDHYSLLKTIEVSWGLPPLTAKDAGAVTMDGLFSTITAAASANPSGGWAPLTVRLAGSGSGGTPPYEFRWDFGDGTPRVYESAPTHVYSSAGSYRATFRVTDNSGQGAYTFAAVTTSVVPPLTASASAGPSTSGSVPLSVAFSGSAGGGAQPYRWAWDFGDGSPPDTRQNPPHVYSTPGSYSARLTVSDAYGAVSPAAITITATRPAGPYGRRYHPLTPLRIVDTRDGSGSVQAPLAAGEVRSVRVTGSWPGSGALVPSTAIAVVLNATVTNTSLPSYLTVYPAGVARPLASNLNWSAGQTVPNLVEVGVGAGGQVSLYNSEGSTDVILDLAGWVAGDDGDAGPAGLYNPLLPARLMDTRQGGLKPFAPGESRTLQVSRPTGVPAGAAAAVLNVTVTNPTAASYLTVWPSGEARPTVSNLNFASGQTVANRVTVKLGASGQVDLYNSEGSTDVLVDVGGYFTGSGATPPGGRFFGLAAPVRILDTREGARPLGAGEARPQQISGTGPAGVPATATAVVANVTVTNPSAPSYLTVYPADAARPLASDLNFGAGRTVPNLVVVKLSAGGAIMIFNSEGSTDAIVDVIGYYQP